MTSRFHSFLTVGCALLFLGAARADDVRSTIKFSDPSRPGTLKLSLGRSEIHIQGADTDEVTVKSEAAPITQGKRKDGLRVISSSTGFSLNEQDNVVTLDAGPEWGGAKARSDFHITVPRNTSVVVHNAWGGDFTCVGLSGDIEINSMHGEIRLEDIAGGVVASTMNGEIEATIRELREGKPLSFTTMNGEVSIRLPEDARASVRLRTQNGAVLTDFDETVLVTKAESVAGGRGRSGLKGMQVLGPEIQEAIREAAAVSARAVQEALEAVKAGLAEARISSDDARRELEEARREIERARRETERSRKAVARSGDEPPAPPAPPASAAPAAQPAPKPMPPKFPSFTISGGKLVTGTLNGGGPEISVATMNGDVILRKL